MNYIMLAIGAVVGFIALIVGLSALFALPVMWLWNYVVPYQFGLRYRDWETDRKSTRLNSSHRL